MHAAQYIACHAHPSTRQVLQTPLYCSSRSLASDATSPSLAAHGDNEVALNYQKGSGLTVAPLHAQSIASVERGRCHGQVTGAARDWSGYSGLADARNGGSTSFP